MIDRLKKVALEEGGLELSPSEVKVALEYLGGDSHASDDDLLLASYLACEMPIDWEAIASEGNITNRKLSLILLTNSGR